MERRSYHRRMELGWRDRVTEEERSKDGETRNQEKKFASLTDFLTHFITERDREVRETSWRRRRRSKRRRRGGKERRRRNKEEEEGDGGSGRDGADRKRETEKNKPALRRRRKSHLQNYGN